MSSQETVLFLELNENIL